VLDDLDISLLKLEVGLDKGAATDIDAFYFDVKRIEIRPDAAIELAKREKM